MSDEGEQQASEPFEVGDSVRLIRRVGSVPEHTEGVIVGFFRRKPELVVVRLAGARDVVEVRPEDLEKTERALP